ncbi:carbohydrate kinase [Bhargavaea ullalensis]|uniref:Sugar/nucleoside kinase (Ribokinase family) n=1 Tax=Bhargavaea ullalensis TaxID=1265685 RepID=A0ABV2G9Q2_9BACL
MGNVLSVGEVLIDFTPYGISDKGDPLFEQNAGGAPANVAAMIAKLGGNAALAAKVGADAFGHSLIRTLQKAGVDASGIRVTEEANTTLAFVHLAGDGDRSFSFYRKPGADALLEEPDISDAMIASADIVHAGSVSMTKEPACGATLSALRRASKAGKVVSFDPNLRESLIEDGEKLLRDIRGILPSVTYLKVAEEELAWLMDEEDEEAACARLKEEYGVPVIVLTRGARGSAFYSDGRLAEVPGFQVKAVDTTGAGDAFWGAFLHQVAESGSAESVFGPGQLTGLLRFANAAGALAVTKRGGIPALPAREEIEKLVK